MSARIAYDINPLSSIALTVAILIGGHPHPMPRSLIEKSLLHATRPTDNYLTPGANSTIKLVAAPYKFFNSSDGDTFVCRLKRRLKFRYIMAV